MSNYLFAPSPDVSGTEIAYAWWENGFSQDEITRIVTHGNQLIDQEGMAGLVGENVTQESKRRSKIAWMPWTEQTNWMYDRMSYFGRQLNGQYFKYDLHGFLENMQYTVYNSTDEGHYDWHLDRGYRNGQAPRKLSMVVQLSDPSEYEGGELQILADKGVETMDKTQGRVIIFPSFVLHRVTPVTKGTRRSLVVWIAGPQFR